MRNWFTYSFVAAAITMALAASAHAQSLSFPTYAYLHSQTAQRNHETADRSGLYSYLPAQNEQSPWPSAAAMGNSR